MALNDQRLSDLENLIRDSFRVRENHDPVYVDVSGNLNRIGSQQHQIIFGRRGSGKSCLLVHFHRRMAPERGHSIYLNADEIKNLGFPDVLIRALIRLFEALPGGQRTRFLGFRLPMKGLAKEAKNLRDLLEEPEQAAVRDERSRSSSSQVGSEVSSGGARLTAGGSEGSSRVRTAEFTERKLDYLERHLHDFKAELEKELPDGKLAFLLLDDFYQVRRPEQPDFIDYLHRLLRGTNCYLKVGTIRHRTTLVRQTDHTVGVELSQDVEPLYLDRTLEDVPDAQAYLGSVLNEMGRLVGIDDVLAEYLNPEAPLALTLASGGVPRDFLTIFVEALGEARAMRPDGRWITPQHVYKGAARYSYRSKLVDLRADAGNAAVRAEILFDDIWDFCLHEKRKTTFLIAQSEVGAYSPEHELIQQLMDSKLVHTVQADTSAASGREGRYEAYTLDAASFMEPRRRNIEVVEFWKKDDQRRPLGLRESPVYPLQRARDVLAAARPPNLEARIIQDVDSAEV